jgi:LmbE family N-acetylglucosaminyl deacetylase
MRPRFKRVLSVLALFVGLQVIGVIHITPHLLASETATANPDCLKIIDIPEQKTVDPNEPCPSAAVTKSTPPAPFIKKELDVPVRLRLLVFAPHPDDEALATSGLIQRVLERGGQVRIVFITNGDGFPDGVRRDVGRYNTSSSDFIEYGKQRHGEAVIAMERLGLDPDSGIFLGFPDDGIDDLWTGHWSKHKPFTSPHTRLNSPSYSASLSNWVKYAGSDLQEEIIRTMCEFMPDWVILPDPRDTHPDHCTTGVFVLNALRKLREDGETTFVQAQVFTYLVHYPGYPVSKGWVKDIETAGIGGSYSARKALSKTRWTSLSLTADEQDKKRQAISAHVSQIEAMCGFLKQFVLSYELFGRLEGDQVMTVPNEHATLSLDAQQLKSLN